MVFHVLPLACDAGLSPLAKRFGTERIVWLGILLVVVLEPTFQTL